MPRGQEESWDLGQLRVGGSALGMSTRVPRALQERAQHGSCQLLLPPPGGLSAPRLSLDFRELQGTGGRGSGGLELFNPVNSQKGDI